MTEAEKKEYLEKVAAERNRMKTVAKAVTETDAGKELFRFLHNICGYDKSSRVFNKTTGEVDTVGTAINETYREVYLQLRALVPIHVLKDIEYFEKPEETNQ